MPKLINVPGVGRVPVPDDYTFDQILSLREQLQKKAGLEPDLTPQFGLGELASRGFERGLERTKIAFGDVIPAMVASGLGFADDYAKRQMEEAVASEQALQERLPAMYKSYEDIKSLGDVPGYVAETFGEVGPDILTSLIPGTIGAQFGKVAAQTAARQALAGAARQGLTREAAVKAAEAAAERSATRGMLAGTYLGSYAQNTPEVFQSIYQETGKMEPAVAALYGGLSSALDSILPAKVLDQLGTVGKGALIREMVKESGADPKIWKKIGAGVAKGFVTEGVTETGQEFINNLAVKTLKENYDLFSPDNVTRYIDSFLRGAIVGGGVSLPSSTVEAVRERGLVKARQAEEATKVAEQQRVEAETVAAQQKLEAQNQILSKIPEGIEPIRMGEDIFTVEQTGKAEDLIPQGYVVSGVQDRVVDTLSQATKLKDSMESTKDADIKQQEEERTKLIERLAKLDEELDRKQKDVINVSREDFEAFRDKTYPEQANKLNEQIGIKDQILEALQKPIQIKPLEETKPRGANEFTAFKHTLEGRVPVSTGDTPDIARNLAFKQPEEVSAPPVSANAPVVSANAPEVSADQTVSAEPSADLIAQEEVTGEPVEELRKELDRLGLPDVGVKLYNTLLGQGTPVDGAFTNQTISIAMNPTRSRIQTLHHEAIHAFKEAGLFTDSEWKALTTAAKKDWLKRKWPALQGKTVAELYSDMSPEIQIEEAIAVAFEHYMQKAFSPAGLVASAFKKLANFFGRIRNFFTGKGYQTADDVFDFVASGAMRYKIKPSEVSIGPTSINEEDPSFKFARRTKPAPKKTVTAYKLFRVDKERAGKLFPLFVDANTPVPVGEWMDADMAEGYAFQGKNGHWYIPSTAYQTVNERTGKRETRKTGQDVEIPDEKTRQELIDKGFLPKGSKAKYVTGLARRPGWHAGDLPMSTHLGGKSPGSDIVDFRPDNQVWAEVEMPADKDWQEEAYKRADRTKDGKIIVKTADITDEIPVDGFYRYKTSPTMTGNWLIGGSMKINRILSDEEVAQINDAAGVKDMPRKKPFNPAEYGFGKAKFARAPSVESEEFKRWFGDSKVVDKDGKPLVVYHGTDAEDFDVFRPGSFFSTNPKEASAYAKPTELQLRSRGEQKYRLVSAPKEMNRMRVPYKGLLEDFDYVDIGTVVATDQGAFRRRKGGWDAFDNLDVNYDSPLGSEKSTQKNHPYAQLDLPYYEETLEVVLGSGEEARNTVAEYDAYLKESFPGGTRGRVIPVYLSIKNPIRLNPLQANRLGLRLGAKEEDVLSVIEKYAAQGYDGIITESDEATFNEDVAEYFGEVPTQYIAFRPEQIKSAVGNVGAFGQREVTLEEAKRLGLTPAQAKTAQKKGDIRFAKAPPVETKEFKQWFGNSKVVDDKGKPLVVYHGTNAGFFIFEPTKIGEFGPAMYFSSSANDAAAYAGVKRRGQEEGAPNIIPVHLSIQNPYIKGVSAFWKEFGREGESDAQAIERVKAAGYDGIVETKSDWRGKQFKHYIVFDPTQVKSVYNVGTFDPSKKDIRFARNVIDISNQLEDKEDRELERYATEGGVYSAMQMLTPQVRADIRKTLALADTALKDDGTIFFDQDREFADRFINNVTYVYDGLGRGDLDYAEIRTPALIKEAKELAKDLQTRIEEHIQHKQKGLKLVKFARSPLEGSEKFKQWFKDSKITEDGRPKVMYHGTSRDIESFRPKQANAIFLTDSPKFAEAFSLDSYAWLARHVDEWATPEIKAQVEKKAQDLIRQDYKGKTRAEILAQLKNRKGEGLDYLTRAYQELVPVGPNLIPVYVSAQNPFDFENPEHVSKVVKKIREADKGYSADGLKRGISAGLWSVIEKPHTQKAIRALGFDGFYVEEGGTKNLAVYEPSQVKSVFNIGDFSIDDRRLSFARSPIADMQEKALEKIDAVQSKEASNGYNLAKSPVTAKQGMNVVNQFMAQSPTFGKQVVDKILDMGLDNKKLLYNFLTLEQLADVGKDILPEMTTYYETFQEMAGYRDKQLFAANKIAKELSDLSRAKPDQSELLADVAHSSTLASFDPDRPGTDKNPAITQMWNKLDPQAKALYRKMRDFYEDRYNAYYALLLQRIDSAITDKNKKAEINARLKKQFETAKVKGPYFPLARFGQYWVSYNDGVERFVMFENRSEAEKFKQSISHLKDVKAGLREERNLNMPIPNSVIKELIDTVDSAKNPTELKQDLWAAYLTMLPEVSMRKHFIPRKGTPGYSNDIVRVFAENTFHGAYNLARLKYAPQFEKSMDQMRERIGEANKKGEGAEPQELFNALLKRQEFILNPTPSSMFSNAAGILGFTWFLTAPASAITNLSQNATVAYPILGARFGFGKAMNEMLGASRLFMSSGERNLDEPFSMVRALEQRVKESSGADKKRYERELKAIEALMDNGTLSRTQTMDLAQLTDKPSIVGTKLNTFMKWTAAMFHGAEVFNRSTTAYAAYRMAFDKTGDHEAAIKEASRLVRRSHFDYSASNKAPIAQGEYAKVIFMFKQYGMNMTYLLLREAQILGKHVIKRYKGTPLEQEAIDRAREARDTLVGIMGVTGLFSGVMGLPYPMYLMTMLIANALFGDEEDEVFDAETRFKLWLTDSLGASAADIIAKGPISYLTGADFSERVSMNGLIFREVGRLGAKQAEEQEQKEATLQWIADITGPLGGLAINFSKGLGAMSNGNVYQGIEMMIPLAVANAMKGFRYYTEGVLTMKGDPIVEEVNTYQSFLRAIGYAPTEVARQLEENTAIRAVESQATLSRKRLLNRFALAVHQNDFDAIEDIEAAIEKFNEKYPGYEITGQTLTQSLRARNAASAETEHGLRINKRIRDVYERGSRLNEE